MITHPGGGQPAGPGGRSRATTSSPAAGTTTQGRDNTAPITWANPRQPTSSRHSPNRVAGQRVVAPGKSAPTRATCRIGSAAQPASHPTGRAKAGLAHPSAAVTSLRIVTGPTNGPARTLAPSPARLTVPDNAVTRGWVANWAASGTQAASATQPGAHLDIATAQPRAHNRIPRQAATGSTRFWGRRMAPPSLVVGGAAVWRGAGVCQWRGRRWAGGLLPVHM